MIIKNVRNTGLHELSPSPRSVVEPLGGGQKIKKKRKDQKKHQRNPPECKDHMKWGRPWDPETMGPEEQRGPGKSQVGPCLGSEAPDLSGTRAEIDGGTRRGTEITLKSY